MRSLTVILLLLSAGAVRAQDDLNVLKADADTPARKMLYTYLEGQAHKHFDGRRQAIAALKTPADVERRQQDLKAHFLEALGGLPERTPLNAMVVGQDLRDGYRVERVIYESRPNHHVTALFYVPDGKGPFPGVLLPCGHDTNGKAASSYQHAGMFLAKNGIALLCYDPIGQGERAQSLDRMGKPTVASSTSEHTLVGVGALLIGQCTASYRIWDGMRGLDYLASRPEIDPKRLGCTGCSGGGTLTSYLMALDERIGAAAPSCYVTSLERLFATIGPQDGEQNIPGQVAFGMEHADYLTLRTPRPTLLLVASQDFFDNQGTWTTFRESKRIYGLMGFGERVDLAEFDTKHGYPRQQREAMVRFMRRWLLNKDEALIEPELTARKDADLLCTRSGQVLEDLKGKSAFDLNLELAQGPKLTAARMRFQGQPREQQVKEIRLLVAVPESIRPAKGQKIGTVERDGYAISKVAYETEPGITVPALVCASKEAKGPILFYVHGGGKAEDAAPGGPIEKLVKAGRRVVALDLRGWGETAPGKPAANKADYWGPDWKEAFLGSHLNRPLLGQRVYDLLAVVEHFSQEQKSGEIGFEVIGVGAAGPVVLHAAALDPRLKQVTVDRGLVSWMEVERMPIGHGQLASVVPGAPKTYDLPTLAALAAPRSLTIRSAVDPVGKPVTQETLDAAYKVCRSAYEDAKAAKQLVIKAGE